MARRPSLRRKIRALIDELEPSVAKAFSASVDDLRSQVVLKRVVEALERHDIDAVVRALNIDEAALRPLGKAIQQAYESGGTTTVSGMPRLQDRSGARVVLRFDVENPRAERILRQQSGELITRITNDVRESSRHIISEGYAKGKGPKSIALDLAGRKNRVTGRRQGGTIGLSGPQTEHLSSFQRRLASGKPSEMRKALGMKLRDKRFDRTVNKYILNGKPVPDELISKMAGQYADNAVKLRAEMIARTETGRAVYAAKHEAFEQGLEKTGYTEAAITRRWRTAGDGKVRDTHAGMNGQIVSGLKTPFVSPSGAHLLHPLDSSLGAGPDEIVACRCDEDIDFDFSEGVT